MIIDNGEEEQPDLGWCWQCPQSKPSQIWLCPDTQIEVLVNAYTGADAVVPHCRMRLQT